MKLLQKFDTTFLKYNVFWMITFAALAVKEYWQDNLDRTSADHWRALKTILNRLGVTEWLASGANRETDKRTDRQTDNLIAHAALN